MTVLYFAWVKEKVGMSEETVTPPADVTTVAQLTTWLSARSPRHAAAVHDARLVKAAVDLVLVPPSAPIADAREVAFFPPVTGG